MRNAQPALLAMALVGCGAPLMPSIESRSTSAATGPSSPVDYTIQDARCRDSVFLYDDHIFDFGDRGAIRDGTAARAIAAIYFRYAFSDDHRQLLPLGADLRNGIWHVYETIPEDSVGGGKNIEICRSNGRILRIYAEQ